MSSNVIPPALAQSAGLLYAVAKGWEWKESGNDQVLVETCPQCKHGGFHFYMCVTGKKDGLWMCHRCGKSGNLRSLQEDLGDRIQGVESRSEWGSKDKKVEQLPNVEEAHQRLLEDADALDYLMNVRGFTREVIESQKLGIIEKRYFKEAGEVKALLIPYLVNGNQVFAKYRTLPPSPKDFNAPTGWEMPLYNGEILQAGIKEVIFVEGEADALSCMSNGIGNVLGVPGANIKKATWVTTLDEVAPERIYILYDNDRVGQKGAQALAARIGIERCMKLVLPPFEVELESGEKRPGKDVNEWFKNGGTPEAFEELKQNAKQFDVTGVTGTGDALDELEAFLEGKESLKPTYGSPWQSLNNKVGFEDGDVIDIVAKEKVGKTTFALNMMEYAVQTYNEPGLVICLEMAQQRLARKWVCLVTETDDSPAQSEDEAKAKLVALKSAIIAARQVAAEREADLYFAYPHVEKPEDIFDLIRQCVRRYGVKWVMFDNIQLLCDTTLKNANHRTIHLSQISKGLAKCAKDTGIKLIRIVQPKRVSGDNIATSDDVDGSSHIAKDCDAMLLLHRPPVAGVTGQAFQEMGYVESEAALDSRMLVNVGLSRYSAGGATTLDFDGGCSKVREFDPSKKIAMAPKAQTHTVAYEQKPNTGSATADSGI